MTSAQSPYPYYNGIAYNSAFFATSGTGLTVSQANAKYLQKTIPDTATALETFQAGVQTDLIKSNGGFGGTIYTDPGVGTQTYSTLVCQNNSTCSFGGSAGTCNLGGLSSGINIGYNMPTATQITIATAGVQDTNVAIATRGVYPTGTNKILIGASANITSLSSGTINVGTNDSVINIGNNATQVSNIIIGSKGTALPSGSNNIVIGGVGNNTTISGTNVNLGATSLNINSPLTIGYAPSAITTTSQIGYTVADTIDFTGAYTSSTVGTFFTSYKTLPAGVWLIQFSSRVRSAGTSTLTRWFFWGQNSVDGSTPVQAYTSSSATTVIDGEGLSAGGTFTVTSDGSVGYNIFAFFAYSGSAVNIDKSAGFGSNVKRTRIA
jgi:hypothetical protein